MAKDNQDKNPEMDPEEKLRMENEIEKLKLSAQYGAKFSEGESELPPEVENEWLNHINEFEKQFEDAGRITVAARLGNTHFPPVVELTEKETEVKLDEVLNLMAENNIYLDVICEEPPAKIYRFIIEELFEHEMDDIQIEGMNTNFIYEEFHPNDELDIKDIIDHFIFEMLSDDFRDNLGIHLAEKCKTTAGETISKEQVIQKVLKFGAVFDSFEKKSVKNFKFDINNTADQAAIQFEGVYLAFSGKDTTRYEGPATASMRRGDLGYWNIELLEMPGFSF